MVYVIFAIVIAGGVASWLASAIAGDLGRGQWQVAFILGAVCPPYGFYSLVQEMRARKR